MKVAFNRLDRISSITKQELNKAFNDVLDSGYYILGPKVAEFEEAFGQYCGSKYCVGVASGLDALIMAFEVLGIGLGDEVLVPANTYIATIMAITKNQATPILVEPNDFYNIDPGKLEKLITEKTKAICVVHLYGQVCDMKAIMAIAQKYKLKVVEDCAQAHGAKLDHTKVGNFGDIGCFSFYPTKNLGAFGDGGALTFNDQQYLSKFKMLRNYGSSKTYYFDQIGYNSRLDELQAALLSVKLKDLDYSNSLRQNIAQKYLKGINNPHIVLPAMQFGVSGHVFHLFVIRTKHRDRLQAYLKQHGIETKIHYPQPPHLSQAYAYLGFKEGSFPITETQCQEVLSLPLYEGMSDEEVNYVIEVINQFV